MFKTLRTEPRHHHPPADPRRARSLQLILPKPLETPRARSTTPRFSRSRTAGALDGNRRQHRRYNAGIPKHPLLLNRRQARGGAELLFASPRHRKTLPNKDTGEKSMPAAALSTIGIFFPSSKFTTVYSHKEHGKLLSPFHL